MKNIFMLGTLLLMVGCNSTPVTANGPQPVRYVRYIKVAVLDSTSRPPSDKIDMIRVAPIRHYHTIATLTINGGPEKEAGLIKALAWKAQQMGADSILILDPLQTHRDEWFYRGDAIVTDAEK